MLDRERCGFLAVSMPVHVPPVHQAVDDGTDDDGLHRQHEGIAGQRQQQF